MTSHSARQHHIESPLHNASGEDVARQADRPDTRSSAGSTPLWESLVSAENLLEWAMVAFYVRFNAGLWYRSFLRMKGEGKRLRERKKQK